MVIAKQPGERFRDAAEIAAEVLNHLADNYIRELPTGVHRPHEVVESLSIELRLPSRPAAREVAAVLDYLQGVVWGAAAHAHRSVLGESVEITSEEFQAKYLVEIVALEDGSLKIVAKLNPRNWGSDERQYIAFVLGGVLTVAGIATGWAWVGIPAYLAGALLLPFSEPQPASIAAPLGPMVEATVRDDADREDIRAPHL